MDAAVRHAKSLNMQKSETIVQGSSTPPRPSLFETNQSHHFISFENTKATQKLEISALDKHACRHRSFSPHGHSTCLETHAKRIKVRHRLYHGTLTRNNLIVPNNECPMPLPYSIIIYTIRSTHENTNTPAQTHTHKHTRTNTHTHPHTHLHTHPHTHPHGGCDSYYYPQTK